jgi:PAS domain-containing protein
MEVMPDGQKPIELILARNLLSSISTPAFLVDDDGTLVFFNEAAGAVVGRRFEETGSMAAQEWGEAFGPVDSGGSPIPWDRLPMTVALREGRPMHARAKIHNQQGDLHEIEVSALPIVGTGGFRGAMAVFWPVETTTETPAESKTEAA